MDVFQERGEANLIQRLDIEPEGQGELLEFRGDGFGAERGDLAAQGKIDIGTRGMGSLGPRSEESGALNLRVEP
jgi:hypothetical protein